MCLEKIITKYNIPNMYLWSCHNPNISKRFVDDHKDYYKKKNIYKICMNPNLSYEYLQDYYFNEGVDFYHFSSNPNVNTDIFIDNINENWNMYNLTINPGIDLNFIDNNDFDWDWNNISYRKDMTQSFIIKNQRKIWNWIGLSYNKCLDIDFVINSRLPFSNNILSEIAKMKDILEFPNYYWNYNNLSKNINLSFDFILAKKDLLNWKKIGKQNSITQEIVERHPNLPWNYKELSKNINISFDFVKKNITKNWDWYYLSCNPSIKSEDILNNLDMPWEDQIWCNPNIDMRVVDNICGKSYFTKESYIYEPNFFSLSYNLFSYHPYFMSEKYRKESCHKSLYDFEEELIKKSCHPKRIMSYLDIEELKFLGFI